MKTDIIGISEVPIDSVDLSSIVDIHLDAFRGFFLTSMGRRFLTRLYAGFASFPGGILYVVKVNGEIRGFVAGTSVPNNFFKHLLVRQWYGFLLDSLPGFFRNPFLVFAKCGSAVFYRGEAPKSIPNAALLSSIAVSPLVSGMGLGQKLVSAFLDQAKASGCDFVYLTTDSHNNESVNLFYQKCGFKLLDKIHRSPERIMNRWICKVK